MFSHLRMVRAMVERYNLIHDPEVETIMELLSVTDDEGEAKDLMDYLEMKVNDQMIDFNPFLPIPAPSEVIAGDISIGTTEAGDVAGIDLDELVQGGVLITGRTGSGKTETLKKIISECLEKHRDKVSFWIYETVKKSFRHVMPEDTLIIGYKDDRFNCWREPPRKDYQDWESEVIEATAQYAGLQKAGMNMLYETSQEANEIYGTYKGSNIRPTMLEIYHIMLLKREKYLKSKDYSKLGYIDRWVNKLIPFVRGLRNVVGCDSGYPLEELVERNCIWELTGLTIPLQSWFINMKLLWKMEYKKANPGSVNKICINVFDEASRVFGSSLSED